MSKTSNGHLGTPLDDYRLTMPDDDEHNPNSSGRHTRKPSEDSRIAPSDLGASPARSHGGHHMRLPTHIKDDQHRLPRSSIHYLSPPAGDSRRPSDTSDINNTGLSSEVHGHFTDIHNEFDAGTGRRPSEFSDSFSISTDKSENDGHKHRKKFWRLGRRNDSDRIEKLPVFTKNDNRTITTIATHRTQDTSYRSNNGTTTAAAAAAFPNENLFLPNKTNDFAGFCKGAWKLQTNQRKAFRLETRPSGMYSQVEYWRCTKCDFEGSVNNPENIAVLSNSAMLHPSPPPDVTPFERTVPNNGKLKHHFDQTIYSHPCGVRYRWAFLAKSHICKKGDRWKGVTAKEAYACIFCCIANRAIPPVFDDLDMFIRHVRRHDGNIAEGHVEEPSPQALRYSKTIVGRVAGYDEEFDLNIAPRQKRESRNVRPSSESPSMRSWVAGSKGSRSQTSHS
ncbi:hypothetical protein KEM56_006709 [Ascosphaera pollenicola]|nr:hypothetical protein KEM56_006709 [Ascosphaera pollenicola]